MATSEGVMAALAVLAMAWPDRVKRLASDDAGRSVLAGVFEVFEDRDLVEGAKRCITERPALYPDDNPIAILREYAIEAKGSRLDSERYRREEIKAKRERLEGITALLRPVTEAERAMLEDPLTDGDYNLGLHSIMCTAISRRLRLSTKDRAKLQAEAAAIVASLPPELEEWEEQEVRLARPRA